jgi:NADH:ubiquinone oxidoreductase subunit 6 (subunit J)
MGAPEILLNLVFYALAAAAVLGSVAVATSRNIVRSAFALLAVLFSAAALYAVMKADFIAAAQVLIYVGGILVLIIFAVMLTHRITDVKLSNDSTPGPAAFCACLCLLFSLVVVILFTARWERKPQEVRALADGTEAFLAQYQADGTTGLARGGSAFEKSVVVAVRVTAPAHPVESVEFTARSGGKEPVSKSVPYRPDGTRYSFEELPEGDWRWSATLRGTDAQGRVWEGLLSAPDGEKPDFTVYRGITEPVALALAGPYLFAFEVVSVLLLAALVGAAFLARKEVRET